MSCPRILLVIALSALGLALSSGCASSAPAAVNPDCAGSPPAAESSGSATDTNAPAEELWVIAKAQPDDRAVPPPATGALLARLPNQQTPIPLPLKHTSVRADIASYVASVAVTQQFHNPFASKIEAVYTFPLPRDAAVNEFLMTVGHRKIRGIIRERVEAERIYAQAKSQGYVASLLTQGRPNVFTQSVANIEPGKQIDIQINYYHTLAYVDGAYEWRFPMVVDPRLIAPAGAISSPGKSPAPAAQRSGRDLSLTVHVDAGAKIVGKLDTPFHRTISHADNTRADVTLVPADSIPNRDFVLRYHIAGDRPSSERLAMFGRTQPDPALLAFENHPILSRLPGCRWMTQTYALAHNLASRHTGFLAVDATRPR